MNIKIHTHQLDMSDPLREYAERHIAETVSHLLHDHASTLDIEFADAAAGREKQCRVSVHIPHAKTLVASAQDTNPYAAVDKAAEKISREVRRVKEKRVRAARHAGKPDTAEVEDEMESEFEDEGEPSVL